MILIGKGGVQREELASLLPAVQGGAIHGAVRDGLPRRQDAPHRPSTDNKSVLSSFIIHKTGFPYIS